MKKFYFYLLLAIPVLGFAQTTHTVTFKVSTANITVGSNGIYAGGGILGNAQAVQLFDADSNDVWTGTAQVSDSASGNFIFLNSPGWDQDWNTKEQLGGLPCADAANYNDRIMPTITSDTTLLFCFGTCTNDTICPAPLSPQNYTFQVDLSGRQGDSAFIRGMAINQWAMPGLPMTDDDGDSIWELTLSLLPGEYEYKFSAGANGASAVEESLDPTITASCTKTSGIYTNRLVAVVAGVDSTLDVNCWEACGPCATNIGIEEEATSFVVKPNPASDVLFIEAAAGESKVAVYSVTGALVMEQSFDSSARLDVAALPRGMYIVRVQNGSDERVVRVALK